MRTSNGGARRPLLGQPATFAESDVSILIVFAFIAIFRIRLGSFEIRVIVIRRCHDIVIEAVFEVRNKIILKPVNEIGRYFALALVLASLD
jgi:hypothetical protein